MKTINSLPLIGLALTFSTVLAQSSDQTKRKAQANTSERFQKPIQVYLDGVVLASDTAHNQITVKANGKLVVVLLSPDTQVVKLEKGLKAGELRVGDGVRMFEQGRIPRGTHHDETDYYGEVSSISPLTFGFQVMMTKFAYKEGTTPIGDFATKTTTKATTVLSSETFQGKRLPFALNAQMITFTVLKPERVRFTRATSIRSADISVNKHVLIYAQNLKNGTSMASSVSVVFEK